MAAVGGVTMYPTVGSAAAVGAVVVLGLHCWNQGGQLRLSGVGRGQLRLSGVGRGLASACRRWNGYGWRKRRSGDNGCGVAGAVSRLSGVGRGQLRLSGVGRGLASACRRWNGCGWRKRRSGDNGCGVAGAVSRLADSCEERGAVLLGLCEEYLQCVHVFVDVANFAPFAACFGKKSGVRDKRVPDAKNLGKRDGL